MGVILNLLGEHYADRLSREFGTDYEVLMLMGVREGAQRDRAARGSTWPSTCRTATCLSYFARRVRERRANLAFAAEGPRPVTLQFGPRPIRSAVGRRRDSS